MHRRGAGDSAVYGGSPARLTRKEVVILDALLPLGAAGWMPSGGNETMCIAVELGGRLLIIDAGTGLSRLATPEGRQLLDRYDEITILLSHFHLDHVIGLTYLPHVMAGRRVSIWGPGRALYGAATGEILERLVSPPFFSLPLGKFPLRLSIGELHVGGQSTDGWDIATMPLQHGSPVLGFRIEDTVAYLSDTECLPAAQDFVKSCPLLCHEVWWPSGWTGAAAGHSEVTEVARLAKKAGVEKLAIMHHNPAHDDAASGQLLLDAQQIFPNTVVLKDLVPIALD